MIQGAFRFRVVVQNFKLFNGDAVVHIETMTILTLQCGDTNQKE